MKPDPTEVPQGGGLAITLATLVALLALLIAHDAVAREAMHEMPREMLRDAASEVPREPARDPLLAPAAARAATAAASATAGRAAVRGSVTSIIVSEGVPTLVVGSRRLRRGDRLDGERIERIDDSGYWLHDGLKSRRIDLFPGVRKERIASPAPRPGRLRSPLRPGATP
jgi:hypothetical protein